MVTRPRCPAAAVGTEFTISHNHCAEVPEYEQVQTIALCEEVTPPITHTHATIIITTPTIVDVIIIL